MPDAATDVRDRPAPPGRSPPPTSRRAPFGPTLALVVTLATAAFAVVMPLIMILHRPTPLPPPLSSSQNQGAETLVYLLAFAAILPLALIAVPRVANAVFAASGSSALSALAGLLAASLAVAVLGVKLAGALGLGDGVRGTLVVASLWCLGAAAILARATRSRPWVPLRWIGRFAGPAWALAGVLVLCTLLCLTVLGSISLIGLALGTSVSAGALASHERLDLPRPPRVVLDVAVVVVVLLVVPDLVIFRPEQAATNLRAALEIEVIQLHQNFLLGPANEILHGGAMLVDTASQYGVGSIYLLAGWFHAAPIGYGTLGFLDGALTALWFAAGYGVIRMAGASTALAGSALGVAVVALVFNLSYPVGAIPQDGPLRFGLPMAVVLAAVAGERWPRRSRAAGAAALGVVGVSSIWSLEAFAYTVAVFVALACMRAWLLTGAGRLRWLAKQAGLVVLACVCTHVAFAAATLAATGHLPDWGQYLAYLDAFLFGHLGDLTYDVARWAPVLAVGTAYAASVAALVELTRRGGALVERERPALIALTGLTAYAIALLSYYVDRSQDHILMHVSLPGLLMGALWLSLLARSRDEVPRPVRRGGLAFGLAVPVLLVSVAWSSIGDRFPHSALAHAVPGGESLAGALDRLWHPPPFNAASPEGVRLLERYMPQQRRSLVVVSPDLGIEILLRSDRVDELFLGDPSEASFVADQRLPDLRLAIARMRSGDRMLMDTAALRALAILRAHPSLDPLGASPVLSRRLAPLQQWALKRIEERFALRTIHRGTQGYVVVELARRHPSP